MVRRLAREDPKVDPGGATPPAPRVEDAKTYNVNFLAEEIGVEVTVDGRKVGRTPSLHLEGLSADRPHTIVATKEGFKPFTLELTNAERRSSVDVPLVLVREAKAPKPEKDKPP